MTDRLRSETNRISSDELNHEKQNNHHTGKVDIFIAIKISEIIKTCMFLRNGRIVEWKKCKPEKMYDLQRICIIWQLLSTSITNIFLQFHLTPH